MNIGKELLGQQTIVRHGIEHTSLPQQHHQHDASQAGEGTQEDSDLARTWCGEGLAELAMYVGMDTFRKLSIDQVEWLQSGGKCDAHADPDARALAEAQKQWLAAHRERQAAEANGDETTPRPDDVTIGAEEIDRRNAAMLAALKAEVAKRDAGLPYGVPSLPDFDEEVI